MSTTVIKSTGVAAVGTAPVIVYAVPAATIAVVTTWIISNILGVDVTVDLYWRDASAAANYYIAKGVTIPAGGSIVPTANGNKINLEALDDLRVVSNTLAAVDVTISRMEIA